MVTIPYGYIEVLDCWYVEDVLYVFAGVTDLVLCLAEE
jgi:hypothetical protein